MVLHNPSIVRSEALRRSALSFENIISMGLRSGEYGGKYISFAPTASIAFFTPLTLWAGRLSIMTTSPRARVGARNCSTYALNAGPFIGPSRTSGAVMPSWRSPARKVVVFQWPCGTLAIRRSPRFALPRVRAILVDAPVSSRKTSRSGSRLPCIAFHSARAAATSTRSCSAAWAVFFYMLNRDGPTGSRQRHNWPRRHAP